MDMNEVEEQEWILIARRKYEDDFENIYVPVGYEFTIREITIGSQRMFGLYVRKRK